MRIAVYSRGVTESQVRWLRAGLGALLGVLYLSLLLGGSPGSGLVLVAGAILLGAVVGHLSAMLLVLLAIVVALPIAGSDGFEALEWAPVHAVILVPASAIGVGVTACLRRLFAKRADSVRA